MAAPDNWNLWALIYWEINIRSAETAEPCIKSFLYAYVATAWSLLHFFTGEGLQFFYRFHRDGQQDTFYLLRDTAWKAFVYDLEQENIADYTAAGA